MPIFPAIRIYNNAYILQWTHKIAAALPRAAFLTSGNLLSPLGSPSCLLRSDPLIHCNKSSSSSALQSLLYGRFMTASTWAKLGDRRRWARWPSVGLINPVDTLRSSHACWSRLRVTVATDPVRHGFISLSAQQVCPVALWCTRLPYGKFSILRKEVKSQDCFFLGMMSPHLAYAHIWIAMERRLGQKSQGLRAIK